MKFTSMLVASFALFSAACDKPTEVEAIPEGVLGTQPLPGSPALNVATRIVTLSASLNNVNVVSSIDPTTSVTSCDPTTCAENNTICQHWSCVGTRCTAFNLLSTVAAGTCAYCNGVGGVNNVAEGAQGPNCTGAATACSGANTCDGSGGCNLNDFAAGANTNPVQTCVVCGIRGTTVQVASGNQGPNCTAGATPASGADTCNGAGVCLANDLPDGTPLSPPQTCMVANGAGGTRPVTAGLQGSNCTGGADAFGCDAPDTCNGSGSCNLNLAAAGKFVSTCVQCDGAGHPQNLGVGVPQAGHCDAAATTCSGADSCNGAGACDAHDSAAGTFVATCTECNGAGAVRPVAANTSQAGHCDAAATICSGKDTCNGSGGCLANDLPDGQTPSGIATCLACNGTGTTRPISAGQQGPNCQGKDNLPCDSADACDGSGNCNLNTHPGTVCNDGNSCSKGDVCNSAGACVGTAYTCTTSDECQTSANCDGTGGCTFTTKPDTSVCGDTSKKCTPKTCIAGACTAKPVVCAIQDCHAPPHCDDATGNCIDDTPLNGGTCGGNACFTGTGTCSSGTCSATAVDCSSKTGPCAVGLCDITKGCTAQNQPNGSSCTVDACHTGNTCSAGVCGDPINCAAQGVCFAAGCDPTTGCTNTALPKGVACQPADDCQQAGACDGSGVCNGTPKSDGSFCRSTTCVAGAAMCVSGACTCPAVIDMSVGGGDQPDLSGGGGSGNSKSGCSYEGTSSTNANAMLVMLALVLGGMWLRRRRTA